MSRFVFAPPPTISLPVVGRSERFPVRRIYCAGRNYADHIAELGNERPEAPVFFCKNRDELVTEQESIRYPASTNDLHYEVELVLALKGGGENILPEDAWALIYGYAVGLDMTRRDLQHAAQASRLPWTMAKSFDQAAPCGPITEAGQVPDIGNASIQLRVNGHVRQESSIPKLIWTIAELISTLSNKVRLEAGDLLYTGTPAGVGPVVPGDRLEAQVDGLTPLTITIASRE